ncbi:MAG: hypothetical protein B7X28_06270 [Halothiobacillus sp. 13-55-253]|nr:MAG: hypothetical protein B7X28_06270 [Halothiobacillus sp. 13-55-253]
MRIQRSTFDFLMISAILGRAGTRINPPTNRLAIETQHAVTQAKTMIAMVAATNRLLKQGFAAGFHSPRRGPFPSDPSSNPWLALAGWFSIPG